MSRTGCFALSARLSTGDASGSILSTRGCWIVFGRRGSTLFTLSRTSCAATSVSFSRVNMMMTCEIPSDEMERRSSMPLIVLTASSILSVISASTCSGAAPGCTVVTVMLGKSIFGKRSTPSLVNEKMPMTLSDRMRTLAKTGRLTQSAASHCIGHLRMSWLNGYWRHVGVTPTLSHPAISHPVMSEFHFRPVCEFSDVRRRHAFAGVQALGDLDLSAARLAGRDDPLLDVIARDHEDAARPRVGLDRRRRHQHARRLRGLFEAGRREQPRLQLAVRVRHHGLDRQRAPIRLQ